MLGRLELHDDPDRRRTAVPRHCVGFANMFVKLPSFLAIFLRSGLLAAIAILLEVYGFEHD